jgi:hypothetical protein
MSLALGTAPLFTTIYDYRSLVRKDSHVCTTSRENQKIFSIEFIVIHLTSCYILLHEITLKQSN